MTAKPNALQSMSVIYASLIMGVVLFGVMTIFVLGKPAQPQDEMDILGYTAIILAIVVPIGGIYLYNKLIADVKEADAKTKLNKWRAATLIRAATIEGPCLFCVVNIMLSGADIFLYLYVALLVLMIFNFPTKNRVLNELQITEEDLSIK